MGQAVGAGGGMEDLLFAGGGSSEDDDDDDGGDSTTLAHSLTWVCGVQGLMMSRMRRTMT